MASLSAAEISEALAPWLEHALQHWRDCKLDDTFLAFGETDGSAKWLSRDTGDNKATTILPLATSSNPAID